MHLAIARHVGDIGSGVVVMENPKPGRSLGNALAISNFRKKILLQLSSHDETPKEIDDDGIETYIRAFSNAIVETSVV